jgi:SNF2 family DNA or RNA helicase
MLQPKRIEIDITGDKFRYHGANDLSWLGFRAIRKFTEYTSEICINNLLDLTKAAKQFDWQLSYTDTAMNVRILLLEEYKRILEAKKYKTMLDDDIDLVWNEGNFYEKADIILDNYQRRAILFGFAVRKAGMYLDMGLGKSAIGLSFTQHLINNKLIPRGSTLIVAPKSLHGEENWEGELDKFSDMTMLSLRKNIDNVNNPYADCFIINPEQFAVHCLDKNDDYIKNNVFAHKGFKNIIFDEATKLRSPSSKIRRCFKELSKNVEYSLLMSGLPAPNGIFQLWGLNSCIGNWLGDSYEAFEQRYGKSIEIRPGKSKYFPRRNAEEEIKSRIEAVSIYMTSEEYLNLPPYYKGKDFDIYVTMPKDQDQVCKDIEDGYLKLIDNKNNMDREIYVENEMSERAKLLQAYAGFIYHVDAFKVKTPIRLSSNPKLDAVKKQLKYDLSDPTSNVIIWTRYREELAIYMEELSKDYICAYGQGGMKDDEQTEQLTLWLQNPKCRIMVAHPGAFMYGHTWLKANYTYYPSAVDDNNQYAQSRKRNHRRGQTREVTERHFFFKGTLEPDIWSSIVTKTRLDRFLKGKLVS